MNEPEHNYPRKFSVTLRLFASGYLLYLAYSLRDTLTTYQGGQKILYGLAIAVFAIVGLFMGVISLKAFIKKEYAEAFEEAAQAAEAAGEEDSQAAGEEAAQAAETAGEEDSQTAGEEVSQTAGEKTALTAGATGETGGRIAERKAEVEARPETQVKKPLSLAEKASFTVGNADSDE